MSWLSFQLDTMATLFDQFYDAIQSSIDHIPRVFIVLLSQVTAIEDRYQALDEKTKKAFESKPIPSEARDRQTLTDLFYDELLSHKAMSKAAVNCLGRLLRMENALHSNVELEALPAAVYHDKGTDAKAYIDNSIDATVYRDEGTDAKTEVDYGTETQTADIYISQATQTERPRDMLGSANHCYACDSTLNPLDSSAKPNTNNTPAPRKAHKSRAVPAVKSTPSRTKEHVLFTSDSEVCVTPRPAKRPKLDGSTSKPDLPNPPTSNFHRWRAIKAKEFESTDLMDVQRDSSSRVQIASTAFEKGGLKKSCRPVLVFKSRVDLLASETLKAAWVMSSMWLFRPALAQSQMGSQFLLKLPHYPMIVLLLRLLGPHSNRSLLDAYS